MKIKVSNATNTQLDRLVEWSQSLTDLLAGKGTKTTYSPTTDWSQGGPIIEREGIHPTVEYSSDVFGEPIARCGWRACAWNASTPGTSGFMVWGLGETLLIAAMRCYVASKLGDQVEVPDNLE